MSSRSNDGRTDGHAHPKLRERVMRNLQATCGWTRRYIKFVDTFPMTVTGKVQKFIMREQTIEELSLAEQKTA